MRGFFKLFLIIIIALVILSAFNIKIKYVFESDIFKENLAYLWGLLKSAFGFIKGLF